MLQSWTFSLQYAVTIAKQSPSFSDLRFRGTNELCRAAPWRPWPLIGWRFDRLTCAAWNRFDWRMFRMVGFHYQDAASAAVMMHPMQHLEDFVSSTCCRHGIHRNHWVFLIFFWAWTTSVWPKRSRGHWTCRKYLQREISVSLPVSSMWNLKVWVEVGVNLSFWWHPFQMKTVVFASTGEAMAAPSFMWLDSVGRRKLLSYGLTGVTWRSARHLLLVQSWLQKVSLENALMLGSW